MARTPTKGQPEGRSVSIIDIRTIFAWLACMVIGSIPLCLFYRLTGKPTPCELIAACRHFCQVKFNLYGPDNREKLWQPWAVSLSLCCQITVMTVELVLVSNLNLKHKYIKYLQLNVRFSFRNQFFLVLFIKIKLAKFSDSMHHKYKQLEPTVVLFWLFSFLNWQKKKNRT